MLLDMSKAYIDLKDKDKFSVEIGNSLALGQSTFGSRTPIGLCPTVSAPLPIWNHPARRATTVNLHVASS